MSSVVIVYVTCNNADEADVIGQAVVRERLAACATVVPGAHSIFRWKGKLEHSEEALLFLKSTDDAATALLKRIKEMHSYEVPCIVVLPSVGGHAPYLEWIRKETE